MRWKPDQGSVDAELEQLGIPVTHETRTLLSLLASDPHALYSSLSKLSQLDVPAGAGLPDVDRLVNERMRELFAACTEPALVRKTKSISGQCKRLLSVLLRDQGVAVPLPELLLVNGLRSATPRRLRELETEHGCFSIRTFSKDRIQHYVLEHPRPDVDACSRYWIKANIRSSGFPPARCALALLSAETGRTVSTRDLDYVLPEERSAGKGRARESSGLALHAIEELRERGYDIRQSGDGFHLEA